MGDKPITFLIYALLGISLSLGPVMYGVICGTGNTWLKGGRSKQVKFFNQNSLIWIFGSILFLVLLLWNLQISPVDFFVLFLIACALAWGSGAKSIVTTIFVFITCLLSTKLIWWKPFQLPAISIPIFLFLFTFIFYNLYRRPNIPNKFDKKYIFIVYLLFIVLYSFFSFSTSFLKTDEILFTTWHHWSSYIGPAELMLNGARIFYDTPVQYGLGPTAIIALGCYINCWAGMYYVVGFSNLIYALAFAFIIFSILGKERTIGSTIAVLLIVLASCYLYTAFPPSLSTPLMTPSTGGLRFLPCVLLLAYLIFISSGSWNWVQQCIGQIFWVIGLLWSPESAFHTTFVWGTYCLWMSTLSSTSRLNGIIGAAKQISMLALILLTFLCLFFSIYFLLYGVLPSADGVFAYVFYPPGPLPLNFLGTFQFFIFGFMLTLIGFFIAVYKHADLIYMRRAFPIILAFYAAASYYLGRSTDNNLLNIMPFMMLTLFINISLSEKSRLRIISVVAISSVVAMIVMFGWTNYWEPMLRSGQILNIGPKIIEEEFSFKSPDTLVALDRREAPRNSSVKSSDIELALSYIWDNYHESVTLAAPPLVLVTTHSQPWTSMHVPANFGFMPKEVRKKFLERAMYRFDRPGWLIVQRSEMDGVADLGRTLAQDFDDVYFPDISLDFGSYTATRYLTKSTSQK